MGEQVEGIFRVGIAPLPASAVMVNSSPKTFVSPSSGSFRTEMLLEPMRFRRPEGFLLPMFWDLIRPKSFLLPNGFIFRPKQAGACRARRASPLCT